ncbi:MAG: polysaccharide deacetylase family protein [Oscillospiraceae bacterium]|nr:polysaccharide deacetylase family protein [Oscillospiraceae bacterium]
MNRRTIWKRIGALFLAALLFAQTASPAIAQTPPPPVRRIALTFDDGPTEYTRRLLDALAARDVQATFFVLGSRVVERPDLAARIVAEGHEIGNHSLWHPDLTAMSAAGVRNQIRWTNDIIEWATGVRPVVFRPPYGWNNRTVRTIAAEFDFPLVLWSVDTRDWEVKRVDAILHHIADGDRVRIREWDIILMHDRFETTVDAAALAVDLLLEAGFTFVTVSELLAEREDEVRAGRVYR